MALTECPECGTPLGRTARKCPRCGLKLKKNSRHKRKFLYAAVSAATLIVLSTWLFLRTGSDPRFERIDTWKGPDKEKVEIYRTDRRIEESDLRRHAWGILGGNSAQAVLYFDHDIRLLPIEGAASYLEALDAACRQKPVAGAWFYPGTKDKAPQKGFKMYPVYPFGREERPTPVNESAQTEEGEKLELSQKFDH